jgi:hypothetical protein
MAGWWGEEWGASLKPAWVGGWPWMAGCWAGLGSPCGVVPQQPPRQLTCPGHQLFTLLGNLAAATCAGCTLPLSEPLSLCLGGSPAGNALPHFCTSSRKSSWGCSSAIFFLHAWLHTVSLGLRLCPIHGLDGAPASVMDWPGLRADPEMRSKVA